MTQHIEESTPCHVCGSRPDIGQVAPWPSGHGPAPWYVVCYRAGEKEHCVGVNGDNRADAVRQWNAANH